MIEKKDVAHIAHLARIALTSEEEERFAAELSAILRFVEELNGLDTAGVAPVNGGGEEVNIMREDAFLTESLDGKAPQLMNAVPEKKENWVKVKSVFE